MQARTPAMEDAQICGDDAADEIMERIVRSATQGPGTRAQPRERRRSRANRKSCMAWGKHLNPVFTLAEDYIWDRFVARSNLNSLLNHKKMCWIFTLGDVKILNAWSLTTAAVCPDSEADAEEWSDPRGSSCTGTHWLPWYLRGTMNQACCRGHPTPASISCLPSTMFLAAFACCVWVMKLQPWYFVLRQQNPTVNMRKGDTSTD